MAYKQEPDNSLQELRAAIRERNIKRLYMFHGEETFLLHHYLEQLKKHFNKMKQTLKNKQIN